MNLRIGYSPCPNDTFIFYALAHGLIPIGNHAITPIIEDVETLNRKALEQHSLDVTKVSFHAFAHLRDHYALLHAGAALGKGCGPIIISKKKLKPEELKESRIAIPGTYTTANLLLRLYEPKIKKTVQMPFDQIMPAITKGEVDCGVIIHEARFTYPDYGLREVVDLGEWWEEETGHLIPLGAIIAKRAYERDFIHKIDHWLKESIEYALKRRREPMEYIRAHANEMDEETICRHINLYVNKYTLEIGKEGTRSIKHLMEMGEEKGLIPYTEKPLFIE